MPLISSDPHTALMEERRPVRALEDLQQPNRVAVLIRHQVCWCEAAPWRLAAYSVLVEAFRFASAFAASLPSP